MDSGAGLRRNHLEKDFSAKQYLQEKDPRFSHPHADQGGPPRSEKEAGQGEKAVDRLTSRSQGRRFPRSVRVRARADYLKLQRSGRKIRGRYLILLTLANDLPASRFGITVSRKTGNAVTRNRIKRRLRELQRLNLGRVSTGRDVVIIAARDASGATFAELERDYLDLLKRAGLTEEGVQE